MEKIALHLQNLYNCSSISKTIREEMTEELKRTISTKSQLESRSIFSEMFYVSQRTLRASFRNPALMIMQTIVPVCLAIFVGSLYFNTDRTLNNGIKNRLGAIFFIVSNQVFLNLSALELFIKERTLFIHERASGYYRTSSYFISKVLCDILPLRSIPSILFSLIAYFMIQFQRNVEKFFIFLLTIFLTAVCASSICFFISASVESYGKKKRFVFCENFDFHLGFFRCGEFSCSSFLRDNVSFHGLSSRCCNSSSFSSLDQID